MTQLLTRNLIIELLDVANNPELHSSHSHGLDDTDLEVSQSCWRASPSLYSQVACGASRDGDSHCVGVFDGCAGRGSGSR